MGAALRRSRKPSVASSPSTPPDRKIYFVDRSLGRRLVPEALRAAGAVVRVHDEHFAQDAEDAAWLESVGRAGWIVLTKDDRIRYRPLERAVLRAAGVRVFVLTASQLTGSEMGRILVAALPAMDRLVDRHPAPFLAKVSRSSAVRLVEPE